MEEDAGLQKHATGARKLRKLPSRMLASAAFKQSPPGDLLSPSRSPSRRDLLAEDARLTRRPVKEASGASTLRGPMPRAGSVGFTILEDEARDS